MRHRGEVNASDAAVAWNLAITLGGGIETEGFALSCLVLLDDVTKAGGVLRDLLAHALLVANVPDIALIVHFGALAVIAQDLSLEFLAVEALRVLLPSDVLHLLSHEAFVVTMATIVGGPQLIVRGLIARAVRAFALRLVKISEVDGHNDALFSWWGGAVRSCLG